MACQLWVWQQETCRGALASVKIKREKFSEWQYPPPNKLENKDNGNVMHVNIYTGREIQSNKQKRKQGKSC